MSDYQCTQSFLAATGRLRDDVFAKYDLFTRRRQDWLRRNLPLPDEMGDQMAAEVDTEVRNFARVVEQTGDATMCFVAKQGLDSLCIQDWLQELVMDFRAIHGRIPCENRSQRQFARVQTIVNHALLLGGPPGNDQDENNKPASLSWEEVAKRLKCLYDQGKSWTSDREMAAQIGCASSTVHKAIQKTPELQNWANPNTAAAPKTQSLTPWSKSSEGYVDVVTERKPQSRELDPAEGVEIREYLEREDLTADERAFFNGLRSAEDQLFFIHNLDKHQKLR
jgi:hypothetical protein